MDERIMEILTEVRNMKSRLDDISDQNEDLVRYAHKLIGSPCSFWNDYDDEVNPADIDAVFNSHSHNKTILANILKEWAELKREQMETLLGSSVPTKPFQKIPSEF